MNTVTRIIEKHFPDLKEISRNTISIDDRVRKLCEQNACGQYEKNWACPPAVDSLDKIRLKINGFDKYVVVYKIYHIKNHHDFEGMVSGMADFRNSLIMLRDDFPEGMKYLILGAGYCPLCKKCSYVDGIKCKRPHDAFVSMEAAGIDVMRLMKDNHLKYNNGENTVTYIGAVLYESRSIRNEPRTVLVS